MQKNNNPEVINLGDHLSMPVGGNVQEPEFFVMDEENTIQDAEFDEPIETETVEPEAKLDAGDFMPPRLLAETLVNSLDGIQTLALPWLREKKVFSEKEREMLAGSFLKMNGLYGIDTPEAQVMEKYKRHLKIVEQIPFNPGEQKRLVSSFATYIKLTDMKVTPLQGLLFSLGEVMLKRATYFINE